MGKQRRTRQKLHLQASGGNKNAVQDNEAMDTSKPGQPLLPSSSSNIFEGLKIDITSLNKLQSDDAKSTKSFKSIKSELGKEKAISKKDKMKLRRELFLKKLDVTKQEQKTKKKRDKRKTVAIIGDTNPLHDALPSLESLLKSKTDVPYKGGKEESAKKKGIEKASKRKKNLLEGINVYKKVYKDKGFKKNPLGAITEHVKNAVDNENAALQRPK